jgi:glycosyltransferase involved in cell wall biosynthesis
MIVIVSDAWHPQVNGVVTTIENTVNCLMKMGYKVKVISPNDYPNFETPIYKDIKIPIVKNFTMPRATKYVHICTEGVLGWHARRYCKKNDIKYNTSFHTNFDMYLWDHAYIPETITQVYLKKFHSKSKSVLVTTKSVEDRINLYGITNTVVWGRGVDTDIFYPEFVKRDKILLNIGRVSLEKNLEEFYRIDIPGYRKIQVGDGPMLETYKKKYPDVEFVGEVRDRNELAKWYRRAEIFVFPSLTDTFGLVMLESIASGTPVVGFPVQGPKDVIIDGVTGILSENLSDGVRKAIDMNFIPLIVSKHAPTWQSCTDIFLRELKK